MCGAAQAQDSAGAVRPGAEWDARYAARQHGAAHSGAAVPLAGGTTFYGHYTQHG